MQPKTLAAAALFFSTLGLAELKNCGSAQYDPTQVCANELLLVVTGWLIGHALSMSVMTTSFFVPS